MVTLLESERSVKGEIRVRTDVAPLRRVLAVSHLKRAAPIEPKGTSCTSEPRYVVGMHVSAQFPSTCAVSFVLLLLSNHGAAIKKCQQGAARRGATRTPARRDSNG
eukprot:3172791-Pleurochrysis_carterae.AAC.1